MRRKKNGILKVNVIKEAFKFIENWSKISLNHPHFVNFRTL